MDHKTDNWFSKIARDSCGNLKPLYITPKVIDNDANYLDNLCSVLEKIQSEFESMNAPNYYVTIISDYKKQIFKIMKHQYSGEIAQAQTSMDNLINELIKTDTGMAKSSINQSISFKDIEDALGGSDTKVQFFRARSSKNYTVYKREEMLHIPFDKRHLISNERFSISGLPCLYLGTTSYCCWLEIGSPSDDEFNVSYLDIDGTKEILNLTINSEDFEHCIDVDVDERQLKSAFKLWLLTIATSYKIKAEKRNFKSEYVIPQLIMLSCKKNDLYGVAYYSKQLEDDRFARHSCVNLAVFANYEGEKRISNTFNDILLTNSMNYAMFKNLMASLKYRDTYLNVCDSAYPVNIGNYERQYPYNETEFYQFDKYLVAHLYEELKKVDIDIVNS